MSRERWVSIPHDGGRSGSVAYELGDGAIGEEDELVVRRTI